MQISNSFQRVDKLIAAVCVNRRCKAYRPAFADASLQLAVSAAGWATVWAAPSVSSLWSHCLGPHPAGRGASSGNLRCRCFCSALGHWGHTPAGARAAGTDAGTGQWPFPSLAFPLSVGCSGDRLLCCCATYLQLHGDHIPDRQTAKCTSQKLWKSTPKYKIVTVKIL